MECYCVARNQPIRLEITKPQTETVISSVGQNLVRTSNSIGSCWPEALLFQSWGSLLVLFGSGLSIVF